MLKAAPVRVLGDADLDEVRAVLARDPVAHVFVAGRVESSGVESWRLGAELWGHRGPDGRLESLCYAGANLVPVEATPEAVRHFADRARRQGRRCSSIVGMASDVGPLWDLLRPAWGKARDVRARQPLLVADAPPLVEPDPAVRRVRPHEVDVLLPASVAMFTEEVGVSPLVGDGGALYRSRVAELVAQERSFARIEDGRVLFKAEVGAATRDSCQVQGVWVAPELRGTGLGTRGTAAVLALALESIAPVVSLYVNDYNTAARRVYDRVGFRQIGTCMSVLF